MLDTYRTPFCYHFLWWNNCRKSKSRWTNKDLQYNIGNSAQDYVAAWMGGEFGGEWIQVYVWLSPFENIKTWLISYTPLQNKKLKKYTLNSCVTRASAVLQLWSNLPYCKEEGGPITVRLWPGNVGWCPLGPDKMQSLGEGGTREVQVIQISVHSRLICQIREPLLNIYRILSNSPFWLSDRFYTFNQGEPHS